MASKIELYKGDCLEVMDRLIEKGVKVDAIITDLPYGLTWCNWDKTIAKSPMFDRLEKLRKPSTPIILFGSQPFTSNLIESNIKNFKYCWYWIKNIKGNYLNAKRQPLRQLEEIMVFYKHNYHPQGLKAVNKIGKRGIGAKTTLCNYKNEWSQENEGYPSNILKYDLDSQKFHPTQKPVALLEYLIKTYTKEGETVLDFTFGSCTTGVACMNTNRNFIGIELDDKYFDISVNRVKQNLKEDDELIINE